MHHKAWAKVVACTLIMITLLTACGRRDGVLYADNAVVVERSGAATTITDTAAGTAYRFTVKRVRRTQNENAAVMRTAEDTDTLRILTVKDMLFIVEKVDGKYILIKAR